MMFWLLATLLTLLALGFVLFPLLRQHKNNAPESNELNVVLHKKRLAELETEFENGALDETKYKSAREEIERDLLADIKNNNNNLRTDTVSSPQLAIIIGIILPVVAVSLYFILGSWHKMDDNQRASIHATQQDNMPPVEEMIQRLETNLEQNPADHKGWELLGRSYLHIENLSGATQAFEKALALNDKPSASLLVDYAEAIALGQELKLMGKPTELLKRALAINPQHQKGIWLSGFAYYQAEAYPLAIQHWKNLQSLLPADSPDQQILNKYIEQASQRGGIKQTDSSQSAKINIKVSVKLDNSLQGKVSANDTVFIYANAAQGPRMPLAIVRKQVRDLPVTVTLNETMAMTPQMSLLNFPEIIINARISKSGQAVSQAGDLIGQTGKLKTNDTTMVNIEINQVKE